MKKLDKYNVLELTDYETKSINGGFFQWIVIVAGIQLLRDMAYEFGQSVAQSQQ